MCCGSSVIAPDGLMVPPELIPESKIWASKHPCPRRQAPQVKDKKKIPGVETYWGSCYRQLTGSELTYKERQSVYRM